MTQTINTEDYEKVDGVSEDEIDEIIEESFPASDPSGWTLGIDKHRRTAALTNENELSGKNQLKQDDNQR